MEPRDLKELHIIISGFVQGVSFRVWTTRLARQIGLTGWVKNTSSGTVEICAHGTKQTLQKFIETLRKTGGPRIAEIQSIDITDREVDVPYTSFEIRK